MNLKIDFLRIQRILLEQNARTATSEFRLAETSLESSIARHVLALSLKNKAIRDLLEFDQLNSE